MSARVHHHRPSATKLARALGVASLLLSPPAALPAAERTQHWPAWQASRVALDRHYVQDEFRIHYTLAGTDALPGGDQGDSDYDGVPDRIQDIARQLVTARRCYVGLLGLRDPLESPRYKGRVRFIDVHVLALAGKNGSAGDAIVNYHRPSDPPEGAEVVTIDLSATLPPRNLSPAHELFHVFQNGYSQFKNAWYYEGMARWSEDLLREGAGAAGALPASRTELEGLFTLSYDASRFWQALARATDPTGRVVVPRELSAVRYLGSPKPVVEDGVFHGAKLLKELLEEFERADHAVSKEAGLDPVNWSESRQRSPENNRPLWTAILTVGRRHATDSPLLAPMIDASGRETNIPDPAGLKNPPRTQP